VKRLTGLIRLHRWKLEERLRDLRELERLYERLQSQASDLDAELSRERTVAMDSHEANHTIGGYVEKTIGRKRKLKDSMSEVVNQIGELESAVAEAYRELKKYELTEANQLQRQRKHLERRQQIELDEISLNTHRRRVAN